MYINSFIWCKDYVGITRAFPKYLNFDRKILKYHDGESLCKSSFNQGSKFDSEDIGFALWQVLRRLYFEILFESHWCFIDNEC